MWYSLGPPAVFFAMSSGNKLSVRITIYAHHKDYEEEEED
jgi:hypothetical protein